MLQQFSKIKTQAFDKFSGRLNIIKIEPFLCFGNAESIYIKGRVINAHQQRRPKASQLWIANIFAAFRRYAVTTVKNIPVKITFQGHEIFTQSNDEGVFEAHIVAKPPSIDAEDEVFFEASLIQENDKAIIVSKKVLRIDDHQKVGVISDIDDTIIVSHATSIGKKFWLSISKNAYTRRPFPGVSRFYKKVEKFNQAVFFYVSSSDWSLFDLIQDFLIYREIPLGPILLKDQHINLRNIWKSGGGDHLHKFEKINLILDMYPHMNFYLIGDSGQKDPEIYAQVVEKYPQRIIAIIIRVIHEIEESRKNELLERLNGFKIAFVKDTDEALKFFQKLNHF
jgi:phosphatidate phosphatase APP1